GNPHIEFERAQGLVGGQRDAANVFVMQRIGGVVVVMVVMIMVVIMVVVIMIMGMIVRRIKGVTVQEAGIQLQRAGEIEGAEIEDLVELNAAAGGVINLRERIELTHPAFDGFQRLGRDQVGLVKQHDIGEGDLLLGFFAVREALVDVLGVD